MFALVADVVDYGEQKTGTRIDGMTYSATSFGMKVGTGLGTAVLGWVLVFGGYDGSVVTQSETAVTSIISLYAYIPFVLTVIGTVILYFTNLDKACLKEKNFTHKRRSTFVLTYTADYDSKIPISRIVIGCYFSKLTLRNVQTKSSQP